MEKQFSDKLRLAAIAAKKSALEQGSTWNEVDAGVCHGMYCMILRFTVLYCSAFTPLCKCICVMTSYPLNSIFTYYISS